MRNRLTTLRPTPSVGRRVYEPVGAWATEEEPSAFNEDEGQPLDLSNAMFIALVRIVGYIVAPLTIWLVFYTLYIAGYLQMPCPMAPSGEECNAPYGRCTKQGVCECRNPLFSGDACEETLCPYSASRHEFCGGRGMCNPLLTVPPECKQENPSEANGYHRDKSVGWGTDACKDVVERLKAEEKIWTAQQIEKRGEAATSRYEAYPSGDKIPRCFCRIPYKGEECQWYGCPTDISNTICSGNGNASVAWLTNQTTTGDGCQCQTQGLLPWLKYSPAVLDKISNEYFSFFNQPYCGDVVSTSNPDYHWINTQWYDYKCYCDEDHYSKPEPPLNPGICWYGKCPEVEGQVCGGHGHKGLGLGYARETQSTDSKYKCRPNCVDGYSECPTGWKGTSCRPTDAVRSKCTTEEICPKLRPYRCPTERCVGVEPTDALRTMRKEEGWAKATLDPAYWIQAAMTCTTTAACAERGVRLMDDGVTVVSDDRLLMVIVSFEERDDECTPRMLVSRRGIEFEEVNATTQWLGAKELVMWAASGEDAESASLEDLYLWDSTTTVTVTSGGEYSEDQSRTTMWRVEKWPTASNWSEAYPPSWSTFRLRGDGGDVVMEARMVEWTIGDVITNATNVTEGDVIRLTAVEKTTRNSATTLYWGVHDDEPTGWMASSWCEGWTWRCQWRVVVKTTHNTTTTLTLANVQNADGTTLVWDDDWQVAGEVVVVENATVTMLAEPVDPRGQRHPYLGVEYELQQRRNETADARFVTLVTCGTSGPALGASVLWQAAVEVEGACDMSFVIAKSKREKNMELLGRPQVNVQMSVGEWVVYAHEEGVSKGSSSLIRRGRIVEEELSESAQTSSYERLYRVEGGGERLYPIDALTRLTAAEAARGWSECDEYPRLGRCPNGDCTEVDTHQTEFPGDCQCVFRMNGGADCTCEVQRDRGGTKRRLTCDCDANGCTCEGSVTLVDEELIAKEVESVRSNCTCELYRAPPTERSVVWQAEFSSNETVMVELNTTIKLGTITLDRPANVSLKVILYASEDEDVSHTINFTAPNMTRDFGDFLESEALNSSWFRNASIQRIDGGNDTVTVTLIAEETPYASVTGRIAVIEASNNVEDVDNVKTEWTNTTWWSGDYVRPAWIVMKMTPPTSIDRVVFHGNTIGERTVRDDGTTTLTRRVTFQGRRSTDDKWTTLGHIDSEVVGAHHHESMQPTDNGPWEEIRVWSASPMRLYGIDLQSHTVCLCDDERYIVEEAVIPFATTADVVDELTAVIAAVQPIAECVCENTCGATDGVCQDYGNPAYGLETHLLGGRLVPLGCDAEDCHAPWGTMIEAVYPLNADDCDASKRNNGVCQEVTEWEDWNATLSPVWLCAPGTDATDCGGEGDDTCIGANNTVCEDPSNEAARVEVETMLRSVLDAEQDACQLGTDCADCGRWPRTQRVEPGRTCVDRVIPEGVNTTVAEWEASNATYTHRLPLRVLQEASSTTRFTVGLRLMFPTIETRGTQCREQTCGPGETRQADGDCIPDGETHELTYRCEGNGCYQYNADDSGYGCVCEEGWGGIRCTEHVCREADPFIGNIYADQQCACGGAPPLREMPPVTPFLADQVDNDVVSGLNHRSERGEAPATHVEWNRVLPNFAPFGKAILRSVTPKRWDMSKQEWTPWSRSIKTTCPPARRGIHGEYYLVYDDFKNGNSTVYEKPYNFDARPIRRYTQSEFVEQTGYNWTEVDDDNVNYAWTSLFKNYDHFPYRCPNGQCVEEPGHCVQSAYARKLCNGHGTCMADGSCECDAGYETWLYTPDLTKQGRLPYVVDEHGESMPQVWEPDDTWRRFSQKWCTHRSTCSSDDYECEVPSACYPGTAINDFSDRMLACPGSDAGVPGTPGRLCGASMTACRRGRVGDGTLTEPLPCAGVGIAQQRDYTREYACHCGDPIHPLIDYDDMHLHITQTNQLRPNGFGGPRCDQYACKESARGINWQHWDLEHNVPFMNVFGDPLPGKWVGTCGCPIGADHDDDHFWTIACGTTPLEACDRVPCYKASTGVVETEHVDECIAPDRPLVYPCNNHGTCRADGTCLCDTNAEEGRGFTYDYLVYPDKGCFRRIGCERSRQTSAPCNYIDACDTPQEWRLPVPYDEFFEQQFWTCALDAHGPRSRKQLVRTAFRMDVADGFLRDVYLKIGFRVRTDRFGFKRCVCVTQPGTELYNSENNPFELVAGGGTYVRSMGKTYRQPLNSYYLLNREAAYQDFLESEDCSSNFPFELTDNTKFCYPDDLATCVENPRNVYVVRLMFREPTNSDVMPNGMKVVFTTNHSIEYTFRQQARTVRGAATSEKDNTWLSIPVAKTPLVSGNWTLHVPGQSICRVELYGQFEMTPRIPERERKRKSDLGEPFYPSTDDPCQDELYFLNLYTQDHQWYFPTYQSLVGTRWDIVPTIPTHTGDRATRRSAIDECEETLGHLGIMTDWHEDPSFITQRWRRFNGDIPVAEDGDFWIHLTQTTRYNTGNDNIPTGTDVIDARCLHTGGVDDDVWNQPKTCYVDVVPAADATDRMSKFGDKPLKYSRYDIQPVLDIPANPNHTYDLSTLHDHLIRGQWVPFVEEDCWVELLNHEQEYPHYKGFAHQYHADCTDTSYKKTPDPHDDITCQLPQSTALLFNATIHYCTECVVDIHLTNSAQTREINFDQNVLESRGPLRVEMFDWNEQDAFNTNHGTGGKWYEWGIREQRRRPDGYFAGCIAPQSRPGVTPAGRISTTLTPNLAGWRVRVVGFTDIWYHYKSSFRVKITYDNGDGQEKERWVMDTDMKAHGGIGQYSRTACQGTCTGNKLTQEQLDYGYISCIEWKGEGRFPFVYPPPKVIMLPCPIAMGAAAVCAAAVIAIPFAGPALAAACIAVGKIVCVACKIAVVAYLVAEGILSTQFVDTMQECVGRHSVETMDGTPPGGGWVPPWVWLPDGIEHAQWGLGPRTTIRYLATSGDEVHYGPDRATNLNIGDDGTEQGFDQQIPNWLSPQGVSMVASALIPGAIKQIQRLPTPVRVLATSASAGVVGSVDAAVGRRLKPKHWAFKDAWDDTGSTTGEAAHTANVGQWDNSCDAECVGAQAVVHGVYLAMTIKGGLFSPFAPLFPLNSKPAGKTHQIWLRVQADGDDVSATHMACDTAMSQSVDFDPRLGVLQSLTEDRTKELTLAWTPNWADTLFFAGPRDIWDNWGTYDAQYTDSDGNTIYPVVLDYDFDTGKYTMTREANGKNKGLLYFGETDTWHLHATRTGGTNPQGRWRLVYTSDIAEFQDEQHPETIRIRIRGDEDAPSGSKHLNNAPYKLGTMDLFQHDNKTWTLDGKALHVTGGHASYLRFKDQRRIQQFGIRPTDGLGAFTADRTALTMHTEYQHYMDPNTTHYNDPYNVPINGSALGVEFSAFTGVYRSWNHRRQKTDESAHWTLERYKPAWYTFRNWSQLDTELFKSTSLIFGGTTKDTFFTTIVKQTGSHSIVARYQVPNCFDCVQRLKPNWQMQNLFHEFLFDMPTFMFDEDGQVGSYKDRWLNDEDEKPYTPKSSDSTWARLDTGEGTTSIRHLPHKFRYDLDEVGDKKECYRGTDNCTTSTGTQTQYEGDDFRLNEEWVYDKFGRIYYHDSVTDSWQTLAAIRNQKCTEDGVRQGERGCTNHEERVREWADNVGALIVGDEKTIDVKREECAVLHPINANTMRSASVQCTLEGMTDETKVERTDHKRRTLCNYDWAAFAVQAGTHCERCGPAQRQGGLPANGMTCGTVFPFGERQFNDSRQIEFRTGMPENAFVYEIYEQYMAGTLDTFIQQNPDVDYDAPPFNWTGIPLLFAHGGARRKWDEAYSSRPGLMSDGVSGDSDAWCDLSLPQHWPVDCGLRYDPVTAIGDRYCATQVRYCDLNADLPAPALIPDPPLLLTEAVLTDKRRNTACGHVLDWSSYVQSDSYGLAQPGYDQFLTVLSTGDTLMFRTSHSVGETHLYNFGKNPHGYSFQFNHTSRFLTFTVRLTLTCATSGSGCRDAAMDFQWHKRDEEYNQVGFTSKYAPSGWSNSSVPLQGGENDVLVIWDLHDPDAFGPPNLGFGAPKRETTFQSLELRFKGISPYSVIEMHPAVLTTDESIAKLCPVEFKPVEWKAPQERIRSTAPMNQCILNDQLAQEFNRPIGTCACDIAFGGRGCDCPAINHGHGPRVCGGFGNALSAVRNPHNPSDILHTLDWDPDPLNDESGCFVFENADHEQETGCLCHDKGRLLYSALVTEASYHKPVLFLPTVPDPRDDESPFQQIGKDPVLRVSYNDAKDICAARGWIVASFPDITSSARPAATSVEIEKWSVDLPDQFWVSLTTGQPPIGEEDNFVRVYNWETPYEIARAPYVASLSGGSDLENRDTTVFFAKSATRSGYEVADTKFYQGTKDLVLPVVCRKMEVKRIVIGPEGCDNPRSPHDALIRENCRSESSLIAAFKTNVMAHFFRDPLFDDDGFCDVDPDACMGPLRIADGVSRHPWEEMQQRTPLFHPLTLLRSANAWLPGGMGYHCGAPTVIEVPLLKPTIVVSGFQGPLHKYNGDYFFNRDGMAMGGRGELLFHKQSNRFYGKTNINEGWLYFDNDPGSQEWKFGERPSWRIPMVRSPRVDFTIRREDAFAFMDPFQLLFDKVNLERILPTPYAATATNPYPTEDEMDRTEPGSTSSKSLINYVGEPNCTSPLGAIHSWTVADEIFRYLKPEEPKWPNDENDATIDSWIQIGLRNLSGILMWDDETRLTGFEQATFFGKPDAVDELDPTDGCVYAVPMGIVQTIDGFAAMGIACKDPDEVQFCLSAGWRTDDPNIVFNKTNIEIKIRIEIDDMELEIVPTEEQWDRLAIEPEMDVDAILNDGEPNQFEYFWNRVPRRFSKSRICNFHVGVMDYQQQPRFPWCTENDKCGGWASYYTSSTPTYPIQVSPDHRLEHYTDCDDFYPPNGTFAAVPTNYTLAYAVGGNNTNATGVPILEPTTLPRLSTANELCYADILQYPLLEAIGSEGSQVYFGFEYDDVDLAAKFMACYMLGGFYVRQDACARMITEVKCKKGWIYFDQHCYYKYRFHADAPSMGAPEQAVGTCSALDPIAHPLLDVPMNSLLEVWLHKHFMHFQPSLCDDADDRCRNVRYKTMRNPNDDYYICLGEGSINRFPNYTAYNWTDNGVASDQEPNKNPSACANLHRVAFPICRYHVEAYTPYMQDVSMSIRTLDTLRYGQDGSPWTGHSAQCVCFDGWSGDACEQPTCPLMDTILANRGDPQEITEFFLRCYNAHHGECYHDNPRNCRCNAFWGPSASLLPQHPDHKFKDIPCMCPSSSLSLQDDDFTVLITGGTTNNDTNTSVDNEPIVYKQRSSDADPTNEFLPCDGSAHGVCVVDLSLRTGSCECLARPRLHPLDGTDDDGGDVVAYHGAACTCPSPLLPAGHYLNNQPHLKHTVCAGRGTCCPWGETEEDPFGSKLDDKCYIEHGDHFSDGCACEPGSAGVACSCKTSSRPVRDVPRPVSHYIPLNADRDCSEAYALNQEDDFEQVVAYRNISGNMSCPQLFDHIPTVLPNGLENCCRLNREHYARDMCKRFEPSFPKRDSWTNRNTTVWLQSSDVPCFGFPRFRAGPPEWSCCYIPDTEQQLPDQRITDFNKTDITAADVRTILDDQYSSILDEGPVEWYVGTQCAKHYNGIAVPDGDALLRQAPCLGGWVVDAEFADDPAIDRWKCCHSGDEFRLIMTSAADFTVDTFSLNYNNYIGVPHTDKAFSGSEEDYGIGDQVTNANATGTRWWGVSVPVLSVENISISVAVTSAENVPVFQCWHGTCHDLGSPPFTLRTLDQIQT